MIEDNDEVAELSPVIELDEDMRKVLRDFLQESNENLDRVDSELIELEEQTNNRYLLSSIFRSIHTIKGTCGFFGFEKLEKVTHTGENLLVKLRDGEHNMTEQIATGLLAMVDAVRTMLLEIARHGHDGRNNHNTLVESLIQLKEHGKLLTCAIEGPSDDKQLMAHPLSEVSDGTIRQIDSADPDVTSSISPAGKSTSAESMPPELALPDVEASIRVDVSVLDALMTLVGELVLARNQIVEYTGAHEDSKMVAAAQHLNLITSELQEGVMQTRMQPINSVWAMLPRVVRDLSRACGKRVRVEMEGRSTELDKSLIEAMKDPITHLIRNAVDHGIESPEQRLAVGKPAEGVLLLRAFHEGGQVHIEISDDGGGIDVERIRNKAIDNGVVTAERSVAMSDQEISRLIFLPGLSTAREVSNISGRGVGMDVVKTNIEKISGSIDLDSEFGCGTVFKIRVPLTLAIVPALIVTTGSQRYAIPQVNLIELIRIDEEDQSSAIEYIHGCPVHRLRSQLLPLVYLNETLRLNPSGSGALNIVVLQAENCRFGLVVDQINDTQEIVVKPLSESLKSVAVFTGATILGDGRVALILDTVGIGQRARVLGEKAEEATDSQFSNGSDRHHQRETLLLFNDARQGRLAIPLNRVARLEQFAVGKTEFAGDVQVVQYRGQILPLLHLSDFLGDKRSDSGLKTQCSEFIRVVVLGDEGRQMGLIVAEIIDVVDQVLEVRGNTCRQGVLGTAAIQGQVTELLDISALLEFSADMVMQVGEAA